MTSKTTSPLSLRVDDTLRVKLKKEAQKQQRSESFIAGAAIKMYLDAHDLKDQAIEKAVHEADQGKFISSQEMGAWVDSWGEGDELQPPKAKAL